MECNSYFAVWCQGSIDNSLLNAYVENNILSLIPNISNKEVFDSKGKLLHGPVILKLDSGPGQMIPSRESIKKCEIKEKKLRIILCYQMQR